MPDPIDTRILTGPQRKARLIRLHYLEERTLEETAELSGVPRSTVNLDLKFARAWLKRELLKEDPDAP